jgi:hypothetical protein
VAINVRKISLIITLAALLIIITGYAPTANASSKSPYESGYDHGCDDADISDPDERYINQPEKGPSFHTNEFMRGYNTGYDSCSDNQSGFSGGGDGWNDSCYNTGYDDGQNGPFNDGTYDHCGNEESGDDAYYDGFIAGCMDADNTRDVCEQATDAE